MKKTFLIFLFFLVLTSVIFYPLIIKISRVLPDPFDPLMITWNIAWDIHALKTDPLNFFNANIFYPHKNTLAYSEHMLGVALVAWPFLEIFDNPVLVYNILTLLTFVFSGWGMYLLVYYLTKNRLASLLAGVVFAFSPFRFVQAVGHLNILSTEWLPFIFLYLHKFLDKRHLKYFLMAAVFYILESWSSLHLFLFVSVGIVIFITLRLLLDKKSFALVYLKGFILFFLLSFIFIFPLLIPYWGLADNPELHFDRTLDMSNNYSARFFDYFFPYLLFFKFYKIQLVELERIVYPGFVALILLFFTFKFLYARLKINQDLLKRIIPYFFLGIIGFILSLGPYVQLIGNFKLAVAPSYLLYFLPGWENIRAAGRWSILVIFPLSIMIGLGISFWLKDTTNNLVRKILLFVIILLLFLEINFNTAFFLSGLKEVPVGKEIPYVYQWLAKQSEDLALLELPVGTYFGDYCCLDADYTYFSSYHWKKIVNGLSGHRPQDYENLFYLLKEFPSPRSIDKIISLDIKYFVIHFDRYPEARDFKIKVLEELENIKRIRLVQQFDNDYVFEIMSQ